MSSRDKRIVEMQFDNAAFERGAAQSMSTLQKLKNSLDFSKPVNSLANAFGSIKSEFDGFNSQITSTANNFRSVFLGTLAGQTAYKGVVAGFNFIKKGYDATIGQIISGGKRRAQNIEQAKFQLGGLGVDWDSIYEDLDYAVAGTAYGLDEAARVGSQFVASGVSLGKDMKEALRGISGVAAMTNSSYDEIGNIFTTVAGQGKLMTMQLNQLAGRGLNVAGTLADAFGTTEAAVREMVTKGQVDFHTFAKAMDEAYGEHATKANDTFSGSLSNLRAALSRIGALFATPAYDNLRTVINATTPVINAFKKAITPVADEVAKLMKVVADLAATLLSKFDTSVFDKIMKPIAAFVSMITDSIGAISDTVTGSKVEAAADAIKKFSEAEKQAARDIWIWGKYGDGEVRKRKLKEAGLEYANVQEYLEKYVMTCNEAAYEEAITADNAEELAKTTTEAGKIVRNAKWYSVFRNLGLGEDTTRSIVNIIETVRNLGVVVKNVFTSIGNVVVAAISGILGYSGYETLTDNVEDISLKMAALSEKFVITKEKAKPITAVFYAITAAVVKTATVIAKLINGVSIVTSDIADVIKLGSAANIRSTGGLGALVKFFGTIGNGIKDFINNVKGLESVTKLKNVLSETARAIENFLFPTYTTYAQGDGLDDQIAYTGNNMLTLYDVVSAVVKALTVAIDTISTKLTLFISKIPKWTEDIKNFLATIFDSTSLKDKTVGDVIGDIISGVKDLFSRDKATSKKAASEWGKNAFEGLIDGVKAALAQFDWKKLEKFTLFSGILVTLFQFNKALKTVNGTIKSIKDIPNALVNLFSGATDFFKSLQKLSSASAISVVALSVAALVMSLTYLADIPVDALARSVVYVVLIIEALKSLVGVTAKLGNITKNVKSNNNTIASNNSLKVFDPILGVGVMLFGLATAIGVVYFAIKGFTKLKPEDVYRGIAQVTVITGLIVGSCIALISTLKLAKIEKVPWSMITMIGVVAASISAVMLSIAASGLLMSFMSAEKMSKLENIFGAIMACLTTIIGAIAGVGVTKMSEKQILAIAAVMGTIGFAMAEICAGMALVMLTVHDNDFSVAALDTVATTLGALMGAASAILAFGALGMDKGLEYVTGDELVQIAAAIDVACAGYVEIAVAVSGVIAAMAFGGISEDQLAKIAVNIGGLYAAVSIILGASAWFVDKKLEFETGDELIKLAAAIDAATGGLLIIAGSLALLSALGVKATDMLGVSALVTAILAAVTGILFGFAYFAKKKELGDGDELIKMAESIAIMAGVLTALALALALISKISINFGNAIVIMLIALGSIAALAFIGTRLGGGIETIAKSLIMFAAAGLIFAAGVWVFAKAIEALSTALPAFAEGLAAFIDSLMNHKEVIIAVVIAIVAFAAGLALAIAAAVRFGPAIEGAFQVFINIAGMIAEFLNSMEDDTKKNVAKVILAVGAGLAMATPGLLEAFGEILIKVMTFLGILIGPLANALLIFLCQAINGVADAVRTNSGPVVAAIGNLLIAVASLMGAATKEFIYPIINVLSFLLEDAMAAAGTSIGYGLADVLSRVRGFGEKLLEIVAKAQKVIVWLTEDDLFWGTLFGTYNNGDEARKKIDLGLEEKLKDYNKGIDSAIESFKKMGESQYAILKENNDNWDKIMNGEIKSEWLENAEAGYDEYEKFLDKRSEELKKKANVATQMSESYKQLAESINEAELALAETDDPKQRANKQKALDAMHAQLETMSEEAEEEGEEAGENTGAAFVNSLLKTATTSDSIKSAVTGNLTDQIQGALAKTGNDVDVSKLWEGIESGNVDATSADQIAGCLGIDSDAANGIVDIFNGLGEDGVLSFAQGMEDEEGTAEDAAGDVGDYSAQALEDTKSDAEKAGRHFTGGFAKGIWDNRDIALQNAWMVADRAAHELARRLDEHSPSKVAAELGRFFTIGFANGIADKADVAVETTASMAERTTEAFRTSLSAISEAISSDVEANPTIRPVMDLSNVRSSVGSINAMFSSQSARYAAINSRLSNESAAYKFELDQSSRYDNSDVVSAIGGMQDEMTGLKDAMMDTQIVMDSGVLVGALAPGMDRTLGRMSARKARRN